MRRKSNIEKLNARPVPVIISIHGKLIINIMSTFFELRNMLILQ